MATSEQSKLLVRLPGDVHRRLKEQAKAHERSLNGEIVYALRGYLTGVRAIEYGWNEPEEETRRAWERMAGETLDQEDEYEYAAGEQEEIARLIAERDASRTR